MRISKQLSATSALALILATQPALAEVSASDVWNDWRGYLEGVGYELTATESMSGDVLTVADVKMSMKLAEEAGVVSLVLDSMTFTENGDGTVSIQIPEVMPIKILAESETGSPVSAQIDYRQSGFTMIASGAPNDTKYDYAADTISIALANLNIEGQDVSSGDLKLNLAMSDVTGSTSMKTGDIRSYAQNTSIGTLTYDLDASDPEGEGRGAFKGTLTNLKADGSGDLPLILDSSDVSAMFAAGFKFAGSFEYDSGNSEFSVQDPIDGDFNGTSSSEGGTLAVAMDGTSLRYDVSSRKLAVSVTPTQIPFELSAEVDETLFKLAMPMAKSEEEQDFGLAVTLGNFTMDDTLWNLFDPSGALPRDPATISFDLSGKARILADFMDPDVAAELEQAGAAPAELNSLSLKNLLISAAGATLTGMGDFTFDNTQSFNGMPKPTGAVDLKLVGGNGLVDKLVMMGMLPEEQAMGARMMMGLFAVPGDGEDTLNSKIEINDQGHILANGQRIQ